jgi:GGDEF domain-containing protein
VKPEVEARLEGALESIGRLPVLDGRRARCASWPTTRRGAGADVSELLEAADRALYAAKAGGRRRAVVAP